MPSANKMTTPIAFDLPEIQGRYAELDGYTVGFESYPEDLDPGPLFRGLLDDRCQCPHWGVVQSGQITFVGPTTRRRTAPVTPTTPHPATCRRSRLGPAWWSSVPARSSSRR